MFPAAAHAGPELFGIPFAQSWAELMAGAGAVGALWFGVLTHRRQVRQAAAAQARLVLLRYVSEQPLERGEWDEPPADRPDPVDLTLDITNNSTQPVFEPHLAERSEVLSLLSDVRQPFVQGKCQSMPPDRLDAGQTVRLVRRMDSHQWERLQLIFTDANGLLWVRDAATGNLEGGRPESEMAPGETKRWLLLLTLLRLKRIRQRLSRPKK